MQQLEDALEASTGNIAMQENAYLMDAITRSTIDAPVSSDGIVVMRLKRLGSVQDINDALLSSPHLIDVIARVVQAGCEVFPEWTPQQALRAIDPRDGYRIGHRAAGSPH